jgi:hypothetical protein
MSCHAVVLVSGGLLLLLGTACPEEWRRGGINDRAARKDLRERLEEECPEGKTWVEDCTGLLDGKPCEGRCQ